MTTLTTVYNASCCSWDSDWGIQSQLAFPICATFWENFHLPLLQSSWLAHLAACRVVLQSWHSLCRSLTVYIKSINSCSALGVAWSQNAIHQCWAEWPVFVDHIFTSLTDATCRISKRFATVHQFLWTAFFASSECKIVGLIRTLHPVLISMRCFTHFTPCSCTQICRFW